MNNTNRNKKYTERKKAMSQELMDVKIENQVIKKQLVAVRDMLNNILEDTKNEEELIIKYIKKHYAGLENLKKCVNCQKVGNWERSFCSKCSVKDKSVKEESKNVTEKESQVKLESVEPKATIQDNVDWVQDIDKIKEENEKLRAANKPGMVK